jgi:hypothetical protein
MILSKEDMDFVHGFVKRAYDSGANEDQAAMMLSIAYPQWKMRTEGADALSELKKSASGFTNSLRSLGGSLKGVFTHGAGTAIEGAKSLKNTAMSHPKTSIGLAGGGALAAGGVGLARYNKMNPDTEIKLQSTGFAGGSPNSPAAGGSSGATGDGTFGASQYSPHGAAIQSQLDEYGNAGAVNGMEPGTVAPAATNTGGTQWDRAFKSGAGEIAAHREKMKALQSRLDQLPNSQLDPIQRERQTQDLNSQISAENMQISQGQKSLGQQDTTLQAQESAYDQGRATNQAEVAKQLSEAQENASRWAARQAQARQASGWLPKAYYGARNWLTGDTQSYGDRESERLQSLRSAQDKINAQPQNYYHNQ